MIKRLLKSPIKAKREKSPYIDGHTFSNKKRNKKYKIKPGGYIEESRLIYQNGKLIREMAQEKYDIWKMLFDKGLHVEPIIDAKKYTKTILKKINAFAGNTDVPDVIVTSKPVGYSLRGTEKIGTEKNTIAWLEKNKKIQLADYQKFSIARQMIPLIRAVWKEGYTHNHAHGGNWTVTFKNGEPTVYLIDFDKIKVLNQSNLIREQRIVAATIYEFIGNTNYKNLDIKIDKLIYKPIN